MSPASRRRLLTRILPLVLLLLVVGGAAVWWWPGGDDGERTAAPPSTSTGTAGTTGSGTTTGTPSTTTAPATPSGAATTTPGGSTTGGSGGSATTDPVVPGSEFGPEEFFGGEFCDGLAYYAGVYDGVRLGQLLEGGADAESWQSYFALSQQAGEDLGSQAPADIAPQIRALATRDQELERSAAAAGYQPSGGTLTGMRAIVDKATYASAQQAVDGYAVGSCDLTF